MVGVFSALIPKVFKVDRDMYQFKIGTVHKMKSK